MASNEKLHAACDECRTRKLKCSGDKPNCTRCQREKLECVFSLQKQMGRPRKRRREGDPEETAAQVPDMNNSPTSANSSSSFIFTDFGIVTPPQHRDPNFLGDVIVSEDGATQQHIFGGSNDLGISPISNMEFNPDQPIDPSLWEDATADVPLGIPNDQVTLVPCNCLSLLYLTLSELQSVTSFHFPQVVIPLRKGMGVLSDLIHCPQCPKDSFSAIQNISAITSLCKAIVERFSKVLMTIDAEAERLEQTGEKKPYRIGDNTPALHHLHTGTLDCPMGFNIEIGAQDWKRLAKAALKTEIYGNGSNPRPFLQLLKEAEERGQRWHDNKDLHCKDRQHLFGKEAIHRDGKCSALGVDNIRWMISNLRWD